MDSKEAELIKRRNQDLFRIKELERNLEELQKTLKIMKIQGQNCTQERVEELQEEIGDMKAKTENEELYTLILN